MEKDGMEGILPVLVETMEGLDSMYNNQVLNLDAKVSFAYVRYMPELAFGKAMIEVFINLYIALQLILRRSLCAPSYLSIQEQPHLQCH